jgi:trehalose 6-phosphate synthase
MSRLVVLSNRVPRDDTPSGGLVVALHDCLTSLGGEWIGSSDRNADVSPEEFTEIGEGAYRRLTFDLSEAEYRGFYLGYANSVLWPLFHWRSDLINVRESDAAAYAEVNRRLARMLSKRLQPDDLLWVHDYHFLPVAHEMRRLGVGNRIGFFLHTPFPHAQDLMALPERDRFTDWLAAFDLVGLQAERDVAACLELFRGEAQAEFLRDGRIKLRRRRFRVMSLPIGIDVDTFARLAISNENAVDLRLAENDKLVIGVDRLDYTKGLSHRFDAFGAYLERHSGAHPPATFLQIAQPSRSALEAYQDIREELENKSGRVNGTYGTLDWVPIRYINQSVPREILAGLYRRAEVGLVTPFADGMNLVAKEYVAAQDPEDPGVLILSHFAGAAEQLDDALLVNPYDIGEMAEAIARALDMDRDERIARHTRMMETLKKRDAKWWSKAFLDCLADNRVATAA